MSNLPRMWSTSRLGIRPAEVADARHLFEGYVCDPDVSRYMTWKPHREISETVEFLLRCELVWKSGTAFPWTLWLKSDGEFAGMLEARVKGASMDIGYVLSPRLWRQGLMSEAVSGLIQWGFELPSIFRIWAVCDVDNIASAGLLERVGMQREGILRKWLVHPNISKEPRDCLCYSIVKA